MGASTKLEMHVRSSKTKVIFDSVCGWQQNGWNEAEYGSHVEVTDETVI